MDITIHPQKLKGTIHAIPSKSQAHRLLLCAAFADKPTTLLCPQTNRDIQATAECLSALGAQVLRTEDGYLITPIQTIPQKATLNCCESGSTLRFLLPIVGALGVDATFTMEGRLPQRPLSPLWEEMERMGCRLTRPTGDTIRCQGKLQPGRYTIDGSVSSQFVTGLLFALSLVTGNSQLHLTGKVESLPYIEMTLEALSKFGVEVEQQSKCYHLKQAHFSTPGTIQVEGDWSNGAFWLAANALGSELNVVGLNERSAQGDRSVTHWLCKLTDFCTIDASNIPDLVPILAVVAGAKHGAAFINAQRLRIKESDRLQTVADLINNIGGNATVTDDGLIVQGTSYTGGTIRAAGDHRIAMAAAIAATVCTQPITILGAEAVSKSYPAFWADYETLGGIL